MKKVIMGAGAVLVSALLMSCSAKIGENAFVSVKNDYSGHFYLKAADSIHSLSFRTDGNVKLNELDRVSKIESYEYDEKTRVVTLKETGAQLYFDKKTQNLYSKVAEGKKGGLGGNVFNLTVETDGDMESLEFSGHRTLKINNRYSEPYKVNYSIDTSKQLITFEWNSNKYQLLFNPVKGELYTEVARKTKKLYGVPKVKATGKKGLPEGFVRVQGGVFLMGSEEGEDVEKPVHQVSLNSFYISKTEVTQQLYADVMNQKPSHFTGNANGELASDRPVENVSWFDAIVFLNKLSLLENRYPYYSVEGIPYPDFWDYEPGKGKSINGKITVNEKADGYRLPSEAEWEYAARGGSDGDGSIEYGWFEGNSKGTTHESGKQACNELGIFDMSGNVSEWCGDWFDDYGKTPVTNPKGAEKGTSRVIRGSSWASGAYACTVSFRDYSNPDILSDKIGFRMVCSAGE